MDLESVFGTATPVIGMVHLEPLPGAPRFDGDREAILERARADARALDAGGVDAVMVENFGDVPFHRDDVPKHVVASMTRAADEVRRVVDVPIGINTLRNDTVADLAVAQAVGADFVRANVHTGVRVTDQGLIEGRAAEVMRERDRLDCDVAVFADHDVKHSAPVSSEGYAAESFADGVERGLADAVVVTGMGTGQGVDHEDLEAAAARREEYGLDVPLFVGSGVTEESVGAILKVADGVIVGTSLKQDGTTSAPVDQGRVEALVAAARES